MTHPGSHLRVLATTAAVAAATLAVFVGLLVVAEAVPDRAVAQGLEEAVEAGHYGPNQFPDGMGGVQTGFTDCVILGVGLGEPRQPMGLVDRALYAPRLASCDKGAEQVHEVAQGGEVRSAPYYRYWNGHTILTRPAVATIGVAGLHVLVAVLGLAAFAFAIIVFGRRAGWAAAAALFAPLLVGTNAVVTPFGSVAHAIALTAVGVGTGAVAVATDRWGQWGAAAAAAGGAALFVYVDQLTTPAMPWALATFVAGAVLWAQGRDLRATTWTVVTVGAVWPVAYAVTWASRWVVAAIAFGPGVIRDVLDQSRFRLSGDHPRVTHQLGAATDVNVTWWLHRIVTSRLVLVGAAIVVVAALVVAVRRHGWQRLLPAAVLAAPLLIVPAWYELLSNHSQIHRHFTYRSVLAGIGVGAAACVVAAARRRGPT